MAFLDSRLFRIIFGLLVLFVFYHSWIINHDKDLDIFIEGSKCMFNGESPYGRWLGKAGLQYYYSPFFALVLWPLKDTPQLFYGFVWTALNFYLLFRICQLLLYFLPVTAMDQKPRRLFIFFVFLCSVRFILDNLGLGQMTIVLVWAAMEILHLDLHGKPLYAGALLALVINIKLIPLALFCYFAYQGNWKVVLYTILFSAALVFLPALAWGSDFNALLHADWLRSLAGTSAKSIVEDDNRPGLSSLVPSLLMETPLRFNLHRNLVTLDTATVQLVTNSVRVLFTVIGLVMISRPLKRPTSRLMAFYDLSVICLLTPLVYPHQGKYALLYTLPAYSMCLYLLALSPFPLKKGPNAPVFWLLLCSFVLVTLTTDGVITRTGSDFAEYFHLLTYGTFMLLAALWFARPLLSGPATKPGGVSARMG